MNKERMLELMKKNARDNGYFMCPDPILLDELLMALVLNTERYGYGSCPCRMSSGVKAYDADIICPCEYRDADVEEHGMCYCGLFVSKVVKDDPEKLLPIPERRPVEGIDASMEAKVKKDEGTLDEKKEPVSRPAEGGATGIPVWRCTVCGYLAAREQPPSVCPICKAKKDRFERFSFG